MSNRTQVAAALETALRTRVFSVNGRVYRRRTRAWDVNELPSLDIRDVEGIVISGIIGFSTHELKVAIAYIAQAGATTASMGTDALNEISRALYADTRLGGAADRIDILKHDIMTEQENDVIVAAYLEIVVTYTAPRGEI